LSEGPLAALAAASQLDERKPINGRCVDDINRKVHLSDASRSLQRKAESTLFPCKEAGAIREGKPAG
jgi:hypothetical protein